MGRGISDGIIANSLIESADQEKAEQRFKASGNDVKKFFYNALYNITHLNRHVANAIGTLSGMNRKNSNELDDNLLGKTLGGIAYEFLSGTLLAKRHFTDVKNSERTTL